MNTQLLVDDDGNLNLTDEVLEVTGWKVGDDLEWAVNDDGSFTLSKIKA